MEAMVVLHILKNDEVKTVFKCNGLGDGRVFYDTGDSGTFNEEAVGVMEFCCGGSNWLITAYWYLGCIRGYLWKIKRNRLRANVMKKEKI